MEMTWLDMNWGLYWTNFWGMSLRRLRGLKVVYISRIILRAADTIFVSELTVILVF